MGMKTVNSVVYNYPFFTLLIMEFSKMQHLLFEGSSETLDLKCPLD